MKKDVLLVVIMIFVLIRPVLALANPSAVYCEELKNRFGGYEYIITSDRNTDSYGLCILPDGTQCEGWDFLKGKCGQEYSYCEQNGNITKTISLNGMEYSICVEPDNRNKEGSPTTVLMGLEDMLGGDLAHEELEQKQIFLNSVQGSSLKLAPLLGGESLYNASDFPEWDWRSPPNSTIYSSSNYVYFDDALGWSTPAKNQGYCGSCWAFSALGAMEAKYNIEQNESRLNPDLSEQHQVSCDEGNGGCHGGMMDQAYDYIISEGVVDEQCFPYLAVDSNGCNADENCTETPILCSDRCLDYTDRLWTLDGYLTRSSWENPTEINVSNEELKQLLIDYGPLSIAVNAEGWHSYSSDGIFGCVNQSYWEQLNHGVVLVGYKDTGILETSYWIIKNSWGTEWGGNGHIKVQFNCSGVGNSVESPYGIVPPEFSPNIVLGNPENETTTVNNSLEFNFTVYNRNSTTSICDLFINNLIVSSAIVTNATQMKMEKTLDLGSYMWNVRCWEQELGIVDISELRTLNIHYPSITINSPENKTYNVSSVNLNFTITGEGNCSYSLDGQANQTIENCENKTLEFLSEGAHYLEMYMTHPEGINSDSVFFTIDTVLPEIALVNPPNQSSLSDRLVEFSFNATDNIAENLTCTLNVNGTVYEINTTNSTQKNYEVELENGDYEWNVGCNDSINFNVSETWYFSILESQINLISPENKTYNVSSVNLNFTITGEGNCSYSLDGQANQTIENCENKTLESLSEGAHELLVHLTDLDKNIRTDNVSFTVDLTSPKINLISPGNETVSENKNIVFSFNATDNIAENLTCTLNVNGTVYEINTTNSTQKNYEVELENGDYEWNVGCNDSINFNVSETWIVTIDYQTEEEEKTPDEPRGRGSSGGGGSGGGSVSVGTSSSNLEDEDVEGEYIELTPIIIPEKPLPEQPYEENLLEFVYQYRNVVEDPIKITVFSESGEPAQGVIIEIITPFNMIITLETDENGEVIFVPEYEGIYKMRYKGSLNYMGSVQVLSSIKTFDPPPLEETPVSPTNKDSDKKDTAPLIIGAIVLVVILVSAFVKLLYAHYKSK